MTVATATDESTSTGAIRHDLTPPSTPPSPSHSGSGEKFQTPYNGGAVSERTPLDTIKDENINSSNINVDTKTTGTTDSDELAAAAAAAEQQEEEDNRTEQKEIALKLFREEFVSIQPEEYTQFLAANDNESTNIREFYMDLFKWDANLLKSTRMLCSKLYLKGESQEIDRILSSFTKSYIKQHPSNVFCTKNFEKIYIVLYSLILLNTALHNSELNKKSKISQADYIKNTFSTFIQQNPKTLKKLSIKQRITIERVLLTYYEDLSKNELHLKQSDEFNTGSTNGDFNLLAKQNELRHQQRSKRMSAVESVLSRETGTTAHNNSNNHGNGNNNSNNNTGGFNNSIQASAQRPLPPVPQGSADMMMMNDLSLSRQISGSSIWSTDTNGNRRQSLLMKRMSTTSSAVSQFTAANTSSLTLGSTKQSARVGFTRALISDQNNQKMFHGSNESRLSNIPYTVRNRQSLNQLRGAPGGASLHSNTLNKRSSRASIISRESNASGNGDDTLSVLSLDTFNINDMNFDAGQFDLRQQHLDEFNVDDYQDQYDLTLELQGSPYLKEGLLRLKILHNDQLDNSTTNSQEISQPSVSQPQTATGRFFSFFTKTAPAAPNPSSTSNITAGTSGGLVPHRFVENFVVVSKGELQLYSFDPKVIKKHQNKLKKSHKNQQISDENDDEIIGDGNWLKNAANVGNYNLCSTFAQIDKQTGSASGSIPANKVLWSLTFPKISKKQPKKFVFEAGTTEIALEFVNTCNFWASKITAIPTLEESISSIEYGWTNLDGLIANKEHFKKLKNIQKWEQLPQGTFLSNYMVNNNNEFNSSQDNHLGMMKQFVCTLNYYNNLKRHYKDFNVIKSRFVKHFNHKGTQGSSNYHRILSNYEVKNDQYKFELNKYKNYLIVLGFGLQLRFDLEDQDKEDEVPEDDEAEIEGGGSGSGSVGGKKDADANGVIDGEKLESKDSELTQLVKFEIGKLFVNMKDIGKIIPTFQSSRSLNNLSEIRKGNVSLDDPNNQFPLVKSPKTFTLANYKDNELPVSQLIQSQSQAETIHPHPTHPNITIINGDDIIHSHITNTIREEEEPESDSELGIPPAASPLSAISASNSTHSVQQQTLNVAKAHIVKVSE